MKGRGATWLLAVLWLLSARPALAHPAPFSYLDLRLSPTRLEAALVVHVIDLAHELSIDPAERLFDPAVAREHEIAIGRLIARRLGLTADGRLLEASWANLEVLADRQAVRMTAQFPLDRVPGVLALEGVLFPYDPQHQTFVNVYEGDALTQAMVDRSRPRAEYFTGTRQGRFAVVSKFIPAGFHHILIGPDHILFLVGLLLLGGTFRRLALIVTGFTAAHSVTLSLAALGILTPPAGLVEPFIALSIVYVGADNLLKRDGRDVRAWIAFGFGFIHGFGFAGVLREMGLPSQALGWSLFSFNVGVEIGQLAVVAVVATAFAAVRSRSEWLGQRLAFAASIGVMAAGAYWFVERTVFAGGL